MAKAPEASILHRIGLAVKIERPLHSLPFIKSGVFLLGLQVWVPKPSSDVTLSSVLASPLTFTQGLPKEPPAAKVSLQSYLSKV